MRAVADSPVRRLVAQRLAGTPFPDVVAATHALGAIQAQDFSGALWALGLRAKGETEATVGAAFDRGEVLRTHVLRPTWHFVTPRDLRAFQALTGPRVRMVLEGVDPKVGLDRSTLRRAHAVIQRELEGTSRSRDELSTALAKANVACTGTKLVHVLMHAELDAMICSGPRKGKTHTYALVDGRVAPSPIPGRDAILADLTERYFTSRGPARPTDFAWWSRLTLGDVRRGLELASGLKRELIDGVEHFSAAKRAAPLRKKTFHLLPNYDELVVAYRDRSAIVDPAAATRLGEDDFILRHNLVVRDGVVVGAWRRTVRRAEVDLTLTLLEPPSAGEREAIGEAVARYADFLGLRAKCAFAVAKKSARARA